MSIFYYIEGSGQYDPHFSKTIKTTLMKNAHNLLLCVTVVRHNIIQDDYVVLKMA